MADYQYELTRLHELDYEYMMACRKSLQMKADCCDFHELRMAIAAKVYAEQAYDMQDKVVNFILNERPGYLAARNAFSDEIEAKILAEDTTFLKKNNLLEKGWTKTHFLEKSVAKINILEKGWAKNLQLNL